MRLPGEVSPGFIAEAGRCWRMVYDHNIQATHCDEPPPWTGRWRSPRGDRWFHVWACPDHLEGLTGLREFGRRRQQRRGHPPPGDHRDLTSPGVTTARGHCPPEWPFRS